MAKITQMSYQRVFNLGNFEAERIELVASLDEDKQTYDDIDEVFQILKDKVQYLHERKVSKVPAGWDAAIRKEEEK